MQEEVAESNSMPVVVVNGKNFKPAHWGRRFCALILDQLIALPGYMVFLIPGILIFGFRDSLRSNGASIGRNVVCQRMIDNNTGEVASMGKKFGRNLIALLFRSFTFGGYALAELVVSLARHDGRCVTDLMFAVIIVEDESAPTGD